MSETSLRLLWVENHAVFVRVVRRQFLAGHDLTVVPSVVEALALLATQRYDVVLVDYDLDDGKGTSVVEWINTQAKRPAVVAVSAHAEGNAALLAAGADAACPKTMFAGIVPVLRGVVQEGRTPRNGELEA